MSVTETPAGDSAGIIDPLQEAAREPLFHGGVALRSGDRMEIEAYGVGKRGYVMGVVRLGALTIHSSEPEALLELADALRRATEQMAVLKDQGEQAPEGGGADA